MADLIYYDPLVPAGTVRERADGVQVRHVPPQDYFRAQVGRVMNVLAVFLNIGPESPVPVDLQAAVDDAVADEYWNRYEGCLIPPRVLAVIAEESDGADALASLLEQARRSILTKDVSVDDAITERTRVRIAILKQGIDGVLTDRKIAIAEAVVDMFLLERAVMEDVIAAEREREKGQTRAAVILQMDADEALVFETALPVIIRPEIIHKAIPPSMRGPLQALAAKRTPFFIHGLFKD